MVTGIGASADVFRTTTVVAKLRADTPRVPNTPLAGLADVPEVGCTVQLPATESCRFVVTPAKRADAARQARV